METHYLNEYILMHRDSLGKTKANIMVYGFCSLAASLPFMGKP